MKVKEKDFPWARSPESNVPSLAVQVWVELSLLVTVTVAPTGTFRLDGEKAKFWMVMAKVF